MTLITDLLVCVCFLITCFALLAATVRADTIRNQRAHIDALALTLAETDARLDDATRLADLRGVQNSKLIREASMLCVEVRWLRRHGLSAELDAADVLEQAIAIVGAA